MASMSTCAEQDQPHYQGLTLPEPPQQPIYNNIEGSNLSLVNSDDLGPDHGNTGAEDPAYLEPLTPQEPLYNDIEGSYLSLVNPDDLGPDHGNTGADETGGRPMEPLRIEQPIPIPMRASNSPGTSRCCNRPPWWGWLLVVVVVIGIGILAVLTVWTVSTHSTAAASPTIDVGLNALACPPAPLLHTKGGLPVTTDGGTVIVECLTGATVLGHGGWTKYVATCQHGEWDEKASCVFVDCKAANDNGHQTSGVYRISPVGSTYIEAYCDQRTDHGGWTVIQRRRYGNVSFFRDWADYKNGFGDLTGDFWLGNDHIHTLTAGRQQKLKIEMTHPDGTLAVADYSTFWIENETRKYLLHVSGFSNAVPPGEAFGLHNGYKFTTFDNDNDLDDDYNCAVTKQGGWWYRKCLWANLNGVYGAASASGINWGSFTNYNKSLTSVRMLIKTR